jgi:hypothetical protein
VKEKDEVLKKIRFRAALARLYKSGAFSSYQFWFQIISSSLISLLISSKLNLIQRHSIAGDYLLIIIATLGIVFATLTLFAAFLSDDYLHFLSTGKHGADEILNFFAPYTFAIGIQVWTIFGIAIYRAFDPFPSNHTDKFWFAFLTFLFIFEILDFLVLSRDFLGHAYLRAKFVVNHRERNK